MMPNSPYNEPSSVFAEEAEVLVSGPGGVALSLTPEAAIETAFRMIAAGQAAVDQRDNLADRPDPDAVD